MKEMTLLPRDCDDYVLLKHALDGDDDAFDKLISRYQERLHATAYRITRNHEQADDAVSDALLRLFRTGQSFRFESKLSTWLHRVAINCARDITRRAAVRPKSSLDHLLEGFPDLVMNPLPPPSEEPEHDNLVRFTHLRILNELNEMPEIERDLLLAVHRDHVTYEHLAEDLHVPVGTVKSRIFRARRMLRDRLPSLTEIRDEAPDTMYRELTTPRAA